MNTNTIDSFYADAVITYKGRSRCNDKVIIFTWPDGGTRQSSLGRFFVEKKENRLLRRDERVVFLDGNPNNLSFDNLSVARMLPPKIIVPRPQEVNVFWMRKEISVCCIFCGNEKILSKNQMNMFIWRRRTNRKDGPFCNSKCYQSWLTAKSKGKKVANSHSFEFLTYIQYTKKPGQEPVATGKTITLPFDVPFKHCYTGK